MANYFQKWLRIIKSKLGKSESFAKSSQNYKQFGSTVCSPPEDGKDNTTKTGGKSLTLPDNQFYAERRSTATKCAVYLIQNPEHSLKTYLH